MHIRFQGQPPREALNTASRRAPTSTTDASLPLSFRLALKKIKHGWFHLGRISIPGRAGGCDRNVKAGATELEGKGKGAVPGGGPWAGGQEGLVGVGGACVGQAASSPPRLAWPPGEGMRLSVAGGDGIGSRAGGGDGGGSRQRLHLAGTHSFPWPQPSSSTHPFPPLSGPRLLMCVPTVCQAPSLVLGGEGQTCCPHHCPAHSNLPNIICVSQSMF